MLTAVLITIAISLGGFAFSYLIDREETFLWRISTGIVAGQCLFGTLAFLAAMLLGFGMLSIAIAVILSLLPLAVFKDPANLSTFNHDWAKVKGRLQGTTLRKAVPFVYYVLFFILFVAFFDRAIIFNDEGIFTGGSNNLGDLPFHLGIIYSFTDGGNLPPENPSFSGAKFAYPFVADLIAAAFIKLGAGVREAMLVQNVAWAFALLVILQTFVFKLVHDRLAARLAPVLLFLSGGLGFLWFFSDYAGQTKGIFQLLLDIGKDYTINNEFRWGNSLVTLFLTQRSLLLGMPLTLLVLTGLWNIFSAKRGNRADEPRPSSLTFFQARAPFFLGLLAGMLPLIHLHSLFVLFVVTAFLFMFRAAKRRELLTFGAGVLVVALPELFWSITGSATRATEFFAFYAGWESAQSNFVWAWLRNTGLFIPLLIAGIFLFRKYGRASGEEGETTHQGRPKNRPNAVKAAAAQHPAVPLFFYVPFAFLFVLANVVKLAPWEWDNIKVLIYWFIGSLPFATFAISWLWKRSTAAKAAAATIVFALAASGALDVWRTVSRQHNYRVFEPDAVKIGDRLRPALPPKAVFLNAPTYNSAAVLTGRLSVMRYPGHLSSHGIDHRGRESDVRQMYLGGPAALELFRRYGVEYVLISPEERNSLTPNASFFAQFPVIAEVGQYRVYGVQTLIPDPR